MRIFAAVSVLVVAQFITTAYADEPKSDKTNESSADFDVNAVFGRFGFESKSQIAGNKCSVQLSLDRDTFLKNIDDLKTVGLLNRELSQTTINTKPNTVSMAFFTQVVPVAIKENYEKNSGVDKCEFQQHLKLVDDFGNDKDVLMSSFGFNRALFKKINWEKFDSLNIMKVSLNFRFTPEFQALIMREQ